MERYWSPVARFGSNLVDSHDAAAKRMEEEGGRNKELIRDNRGREATRPRWKSRARLPGS